MAELQMYGAQALGTQVSEPRRGGSDVVTLAVEIKPEQGEERAEAGGRELRAVSMTPDEARAFALKMLMAAGPDTDRLVRNYVAGQVIVTLDMPSDADGIEIGPWLFVKPEGEEQFEDAVAVLGGLLAFQEPNGTARALHAYVEEQGFTAGDDGPRAMSVHLDFPDVWQPQPSPHAAAATALAKKHREQRAQVAEEQAAADRLAGGVTMKADREGAVFDFLKMSDGPSTQEQIAAQLPEQADDLGDTLNHLIEANCVRTRDPGGDADMMFEVVPGWQPAFEGAEGGPLGYHDDRAQSIMDDPLAPGPGKDGH